MAVAYLHRLVSDMTDFTKLTEEELAAIFAERRAKRRALVKASQKKWAATEKGKAYIKGYNAKRREGSKGSQGGSGPS
jgi:hypothetical protein